MTAAINKQKTIVAPRHEQMRPSLQRAIVMALLLFKPCARHRRRLGEVGGGELALFDGRQEWRETAFVALRRRRGGLRRLEFLHLLDDVVVARRRWRRDGRRIGNGQRQLAGGADRRLAARVVGGNQLSMAVRTAKNKFHDSSTCAGAAGTGPKPKRTFPIFHASRRHAALRGIVLAGGRSHSAGA